MFSFWMAGFWYPVGDLRGNVPQDIFGRTLTVGARAVIPVVITALTTTDNHFNNVEVSPIYPGKAGFGINPPVPAETLKVHPLNLEARE